ncbi:efflux RND transporter periplasmic adaptor subunit [Stutzerimonas frequens]|uniref:efflux RND transporter periplasmic adaptor subunit n=1 Tax=Stutzerimonas frequens TaxID=2968969 RepID=UPI00190C013E|nr:efflux RND transporter periplasmic adaptor subunit [Stutzerimonas frequens]MBK3759157.1 efflux RND transporter periplasmic adaptor subunit [Stutzerimonas frequens]MBK3873403.1 efflux RND transporter periplasmic adaptor subunit [Stutzerimonas frequens]MBK3911672.1 efflux RND transporter periplasmic adaptor subunit [Stutzerimonas frequens]MBK3930955.1 efflux RND transporter periplasmic adaptor subunit [Stutzerimonas frequens]
MKTIPLVLLLIAATGMAQAQTAETAPARAGLERQEIRAQLLPRQFTTLAAEIGAKVNKLPVPEGGAFKAGQLLVSFDCSVQKAMLQKARAELNAAEATDKANQRLAELNSVGQLEVDLGRAGRQKAVAEVGAQQAVLGKCGISAPFAGRVAEQKVREQQFVQPGQPLLDILDDSVLELEFLVPSAWLVWLRAGQTFDVEIDETGQRYPARFERIGARVDPVSQSVKVAAAIDGRFPELIAGMSGRVHVTPPNANQTSNQ